MDTNGIATEFATSAMRYVPSRWLSDLMGHCMSAEYSPHDGLVIIIRIAPAAAELTLTKVDDIADGDCVAPHQQINYTISYDFTGPGDTNVTIIDYLPVGVDYAASMPPGNYNPVDRTVTWDIGTVPPDGNGTFTLTCLVNYDADPCSIITNSCRLEGDSVPNKVAEVNTPVCYWAQTLNLPKLMISMTAIASFPTRKSIIQSVMNSQAQATLTSRLLTICPWRLTTIHHRPRVTITQ